MIGEPDVSGLWLWRTAIITLLVSGAAFILPARSDTLDVFAELQTQLGAKKFVDAEQTAIQLLNLLFQFLDFLLFGCLLCPGRRRKRTCEQRQRE